MKTAFYLTFALLMCTACHAQGYHIETLGATPAACANEIAPLQAELETMNYPNGWTFILVCTDNAWDNLTRQAEILKLTETAATVAQRRATIIRGSIFVRQIGRGYRFTLLHELGHILLDTPDEGRADRYAFEHLKVLQASR